MKKPSIATTVDEQSNNKTRPFEKRCNTMVKGMEGQFLEISKGTNWMYLVIGVAYMMECGERQSERKVLMKMLKTKEISMEKCRNVPKGWEQRGFGDKSLEFIGQIVQYAKEVYEGDKMNYEKDEEILNYLQNQPKTMLAVLILIRSICLFHGQDIINQRPQQYLGNQLSLFADYFINPAYKTISIISKIFNYSIKILDMNHQQINQTICRTNPSRQIIIKKFSNRIFFNINILSQQSNGFFSKIITTPPISTQSVQQHEHKTKTEQKIHDQKLIEQQPISKELHRKQSVNSIRVQRVKICISSGQARKPQQKFCQCKKRKNQLNTVKC